MNSAVIGKKKRDALVEDVYKPLINFEDALKGSSVPPIIPTPSPTLTCSVHAFFAGSFRFIKTMLSTKHRLIHNMSQAEIDEFTQKRVNLKALREYKQQEQLQQKSYNHNLIQQSNSQIIPETPHAQQQFSSDNSTYAIVNPVPRVNNDNLNNEPTKPIPRVPRPFLNNQ